MAWLDSVRGLAALTVIGSHYVNGYDLPCRSDFCNRLLTYSPLHIFWDGAAAVSLFFVLSGLVLSLRYFRHSQQPDIFYFNLGQYCAARICRIWLPYLAALILSALLYQYYHTVAVNLPPTIPKQNDWLPSMWGQSAGWGELFKDSFLLGMRMEMVYVPQAWTLSIELALSLLIPVGIILAARGSIWLISFTLFAIYPLGVSPLLFHFMLGMLIAKHHAQINLYLHAKALARWIVVGLGFFLYTIGETLEGLLYPDLVGWLTGLGSALLLLCAWASGRIQRILSSPILRYIGKISYSVYLLHFAVLMTATPWFLDLLEATPAWFVAAWWAGFTATVILSALLAALFYHFVEAPSMALGKRLGKSGNSTISS